MNALLLAVLLVFVSLVQGGNFVVKKNRRYDTPAYCFAYARESDDNDATINCYGYQYDCEDFFNTDSSGPRVPFAKTDCDSDNGLRRFSTKDFPLRYNTYKKAHGK